LKKLISFDVEGKPPKKSNWGSDDADLVIKFREAALNARTEAEWDSFQDSVKLNLIVYAPNTTDIEYKQTGDDDPNRYVGDLDSLVAGVSEYLQPAPKNPTLIINPSLKAKEEIGPDVALVLENDLQIIEIEAKKIHDKTLHYHVEIESLGKIKGVLSR